MASRRRCRCFDHWCCCCCQAICDFTFMLWEYIYYVLCCCTNPKPEEGEEESNSEESKLLNGNDSGIKRKNSCHYSDEESHIPEYRQDLANSSGQNNIRKRKIDNKQPEKQAAAPPGRTNLNEKKKKEEEKSKKNEEEQKSKEEKTASQNEKMNSLIQEITKLDPEYNQNPKITNFYSITDPNQRKEILSEATKTLKSYLTQKQALIAEYKTLVPTYSSLSSKPLSTIDHFSTKPLKEMAQEVTDWQTELTRLQEILNERQHELTVICRDIREMKRLMEREDHEEDHEEENEGESGDMKWDGTVEEIKREIKRKYVELEKEVEKVIIKTRPASIEEITDKLEIFTLKDPQSHAPLLPLSNTIARLKACMDTLTESATELMEEDSKSEVANQILVLTEGPFCCTVLKNFDPACEDWVIKVEGQHSLRQHRVLHDHLEQVPEAVIKLLEVTGLKEKSNLNQSNEDEKEIDSKEESKEETKEDIDEDKEEVKEENKEEAKEGSKEDMKHVESSCYKSIKPFEITFENFDFSNNYECLIELLKTSIQTQLLKLVFVECSLPEILEESVKHLEFITPDNKMRPLYGISFDACTFPNPPELKDPSILEKDPQNIDKADQIGLLLNIEGLPSAKYLGEPPSEINGGISSIALKNNGFTEVEMAKLKVYLCYAEHLIIYEQE
ncbi:unnamed protein product [Moneuplotes crassus]|uniref:Uncharacterized protein n=1 Tax=Euplotes crassus TaxID=5936 RepID=A0AAD1XXW2_EUPCR|nr:unnamed protein product [Moneuplotes crassus]